MAFMIICDAALLKNKGGLHYYYFSLITVLYTFSKKLLFKELYLISPSGSVDNFPNNSEASL